MSNLDEPAEDVVVRFPVPFSLDEFRVDILWLCFTHCQIGAVLANAALAQRWVGVDCGTDIAAAQTPAEAGLTYERVAGWELVRSLEAMYRYGFLGQRDTRIEELGPGGYHVAVAAIVLDLSRSTYVRMLERIEAPNGSAAIGRCLHVAELANARLTLEGQPRFFNFDAREDDHDLAALLGFVDSALPQGGYGDALTIRQLALLSGLEEQSIRTIANPKRSNLLPTEQRGGRVVVRVEHAKAWLQSRQRYVPIVDAIDGAALDLARRGFASLTELDALVRQWLTVRGHTDLKFLDQKSEVPPREVDRHYVWMTDAATVQRVAELLALPSDLFALRVQEALHADSLQRVRRELAALAPPL